MASLCLLVLPMTEMTSPLCWMKTTRSYPTCQYSSSPNPYTVHLAITDLRPTLLSSYTFLICMLPMTACNTSSSMVVYTPLHVSSGTCPNATTTASVLAISPNPEKHAQYMHNL